MVVELIESPISGFGDHLLASEAGPRHRSRRVARGRAVAGRSCRWPGANPGEVVWPGPASVVDPAPQARRVRSCGPRPVAARPQAQRLRRAVAVGGLAVVIVCCGIGFRTALGRIGGGPLATTGAPGGGRPAAARVWIVRPGDTLWSIAEAVDPGGDVRPLVDRLASEAGNTAIYPGESIALPGR